MGKSKIAITLAEETVKYLDDLVRERVFDSRSEAIQRACDEKIERLAQSRLAEECASWPAKSIILRPVKSNWKSTAHLTRGKWPKRSRTC